MKRFVPLLLTGLIAAAVSRPGTGAEPTSVESGRPVCVPALWRYFPGDFNFCVAHRLWLERRHREAERMLLLAAGWGSKPAQHALGVAYFNGDGLVQDRPRGLAWLALAAEREKPRYLAYFKSAYARASEEERRLADTQYVALRRRYGDAVAAARAERRYRRELHATMGNPVYVRQICVAGINRTDMPSDAVEEYAAACPTASRLERRIESMADVYFEGWKGRVTVGDPASVSQRPD